MAMPVPLTRALQCSLYSFWASSNIASSQGLQCQSSQQKKMLALYVSTNQEDVTFGCSISVFLQCHYKLSLLLGGVEGMVDGVLPWRYACQAADHC